MTTAEMILGIMTILGPALMWYLNQKSIKAARDAEAKISAVTNLEKDYTRLRADFDNLKLDYDTEIKGFKSQIEELKEKLRHPPVAPQPTGPAPPAAPGVGGFTGQPAPAASAPVVAQPIEVSVVLDKGETLPVTVIKEKK